MTISIPSLRRGAVRATIVAALAVVACTREEPAEPAENADAAKVEAGRESATPSAAAEVVPPSSLGAGLDEALQRAIVAPPAGGSSYRVDPFVAALVFAAAEREAERWFTPWAGTPAKVDYEVRGFTITAAGERAGLLRLGLREGDIVEQVNGVPATDAATVRGALAGSDQGVTVGVFREDYSFVIGYRFEPGLAWLRTREDAGIDTAAPPTEVAAAGEIGGPPVPSDDEGVDDPGAGSPSRPSVPSPSGSGSTPSSGSGSKPSGGGTVPRPSTPGATPSKGSGSSGTSPVSCTSDASCTIRKSYFDSMVSSPSKLESQAKIVPAIRNDVFSGYKLSWIRPGSAIDEMGFRSGDKITHINGRDLTDDAEAFAVYLGLSSTRSFKIRYVRGNQTRTKTVDVK